MVPLALPLMAGPGAISSTIVWSSRYHSWPNLLGFYLGDCDICLLLLVIVPGRTADGAGIGTNWYQRNYAYHGSAAHGAGH